MEIVLHLKVSSTVNKGFKSVRIFCFALCCIVANQDLMAQKAVITGVILDLNNNPIVDANIRCNTSGAVSNSNGFYWLEVPSGQNIIIEFTHLSYQKFSATFNIEANTIFEFNPVLQFEMEQIAPVVINKSNRTQIEGITTISPQILRTIKGAQPGVENILKTLPGVSISNELSTQYNVRGGNFDENLVYVNGIEIYRPFLIRSGQQEGLSFVNSNLVKDLNFSAGGFQAKYGDKLSSVLDIEYRTPIDARASVEISLLGLSATLEGVSKNNKWSALSGFRYRNNSLLVNSQETESNFNPAFADLQLLLTFNSNRKLSYSFLGNASINSYNFQPKTRQTNFGTIDQPMALRIVYEGQEKDRYQTLNSAFSAHYKPNAQLHFSLIGAIFHTIEQEYFDIMAQYSLGEVNSTIGDEDFGDVSFVQAIGSQLNHGRNDLDALIGSLEIRGEYKRQGHLISWSGKYNKEDIRDRLVEWEVIDSAGFSIDPPDLGIFQNQPYEANVGPLVPYSNVRVTQKAVMDRLQAYLQYSYKGDYKGHEVFANLGTRVNSWQVGVKDSNINAQSVWSLRAQLAVKPKNNPNLLWRLSGGLYHQPPFYRELRNANGRVNANVRAQKSIHAVLGNTFSFDLWNRPFKLNSEIYYKKLSDLNPYTVENVRIRYSADNNARGYAYGLDCRMNGEFVPGTESWFSFGYLKTEENINNRGYIARPTDQRLKFGILFQDYVPNIPNLKMYLNLVYNTGVPGGSPSYANVYQYQNRLPDYKRADLGLTYHMIQPKDSNKGKIIESLEFGLELFNIFNVQNSITNTWVRDSYSKLQYAIPNYLTSRIINFRTGVSF